MPKLNLLPAKKMVKILKRLGFQELRIKGSHHFFFNPITRKTATVPVHRNEYLSNRNFKRNSERYRIEH